MVNHDFERRLGFDQAGLDSAAFVLPTRFGVMLHFCKSCDTGDRENPLLFAISHRRPPKESPPANQVDETRDPASSRAPMLRVLITCSRSASMKR